MPLTVDSVSKEIDAFAPREGAAGWDPVGLQIGDAAASVESIAVCHEVTEGVVAALESAPVPGTNVPTPSMRNEQPL